MSASPELILYTLAGVFTEIAAINVTNRAVVVLIAIDIVTYRAALVDIAHHHMIGCRVSVARGDGFFNYEHVVGHGCGSKGFSTLLHQVNQ